MRRRIDLGQKVTGKEEARLIQKRHKWTARNKNRPEHENPFLSAIKPDNPNYGEPDEGYQELRERLENLEFGNFPGYFNYRNNARSDIQNSRNADDELGSTNPKGQPDTVKPNERTDEMTHDRIETQRNVDAHVDKRAKGDIGQPDVAVRLHTPLESGLSDERLKLMKKEWFQGKDVLDIGCNRGHVTYAIAKMFEPNLILGIDIDIKMINMANRDLHLHIEDDILKRNSELRLRRAAKLRLEGGTTTKKPSPDYTEDQNQFPLSSYISHGPLALSCPTDYNSFNRQHSATTAGELANREIVDQNEINTLKVDDDRGMVTATEGVVSNQPESLYTSLVRKPDGDGDGDDDGNGNPYCSREFERKLSPFEDHPGEDMTMDDNNGCRQQRQVLNLFPNNIVFVEHNYVLSRDDLVEKQTPFFDTIVCLSVTKWIHLNYRDEGLRRFFKRIYLHLRPNGGLLILEAQPFDNYSRRKKLSDRLRANYYDIKFKPDQFDAYLLSDEVGFRRILDSNMTDHQCAGFKRPLKVYLK